MKRSAAAGQNETSIPDERKTARDSDRREDATDGPHETTLGGGYKTRGKIHARRENLGR